MERMNFGCGPVRPASWTNVDVEDWTNWYEDDDPGQLCESEEPWQQGRPFPANTFDYVVANHSLCAVAYHALPKVLTELHRVLKVGGVLRVMVPDVLAAVRAHAEVDRGWFPNSEGDIDDQLCSYLTWYSSNRTVYTAAHLRNRLHEHFSTVVKVAFKETTCDLTTITDLDDREHESLFMEAIK